mmetsp:Transcript_107231/g.280018  ORF Transcript_107231/g.280018 Transcript_107231/m.280018 type:complete len:208 (+) Transcript_107231:930-1553(+)
MDIYDHHLRRVQQRQQGNSGLVRRRPGGGRRDHHHRRGRHDREEGRRDHRHQRREQPKALVRDRSGEHVPRGHDGDGGQDDPEGGAVPGGAVPRADPRDGRPERSSRRHHREEGTHGHHHAAGGHRRGEPDAHGVVACGLLSGRYHLAHRGRRVDGDAGHRKCRRRGRFQRNTEPQSWLAESIFRWCCGEEGEVCSFGREGGRGQGR